MTLAIIPPAPITITQVLEKISDPLEQKRILNEIKFSGYYVAPNTVSRVLTIGGVKYVITATIPEITAILETLNGS